jgi:hypothetical protein
MVKKYHIINGISRYIEGMRAVFGSPVRPAPEDIIAQANKLAAQSDDELAAALSGQVNVLKRLTAKDKLFAEKDFKAVLLDRDYAQTLNREERIAELIRLYVKERIGRAPVAEKSGP